MGPPVGRYLVAYPIGIPTFNMPQDSAMQLLDAIAAPDGPLTLTLPTLRDGSGDEYTAERCPLAAPLPLPFVAVPVACRWVPVAGNSRSHLKPCGRRLE